MEVERRIEFRFNDENMTFLGTLEKLWEEFPGAQIRKVSYTNRAVSYNNWRDIPGFRGGLQN